MADLAKALKMRIELRQVGAREEARMVGGLGPCGRGLCCTLFPGDDEPVSIRMAKEQNLPLNPMKISGLCGRLMCCLKYEQEQYVRFRKEAPAKGTPVSTPAGDGVVAGYNVTKDAIIVRLEDGSLTDVRLCSCEVLRGRRAGGGARAAEEEPPAALVVWTIAPASTGWRRPNARSTTCRWSKPRSFSEQMESRSKSLWPKAPGADAAGADAAGAEAEAAGSGGAGEGGAAAGARARCGRRRRQRPGHQPRARRGGQRGERHPRRWARPAVERRRWERPVVADRGEAAPTQPGQAEAASAAAARRGEAGDGGAGGADGRGRRAAARGAGLASKAAVPGR